MLGHFLNSLPSDETSLDMVDFSIVRWWKSSTAENDNHAANTQKTFEDLK